MAETNTPKTLKAADFQKLESDMAGATTLRGQIQRRAAALIKVCCDDFEPQKGDRCERIESKMEALAGAVAKCVSAHRQGHATLPH